jgi:oligopeptide transport system permease protein
MIQFILRRLLEMIPVLWIVATLTFFLVRLVPGGPFDGEKAMAKEVRKNLEAHYGLDKPLLVQYGNYLLNVCKGDLGPSFKYPSRSVNEIIANTFPVSFELGFYSLMIALTLGVSTGVLAAVRPNSWLDYIPMSISMLGITVPIFVLGPVLLLIFALWNDWFNATGWFFPRDRVLPSLTIGLYYAASIARMTRGGMLEVMNQDYIRTARAKGASTISIIFKHAFRGGILPVVSFLGPAIAGILTGSIVVETVFQVPGLGRYFITAGSNRDYTLLSGAVLFYATLIIVLNMLVDVAMVWLNPKLRIK